MTGERKEMTRRTDLGRDGMTQRERDEITRFVRDRTKLEMKRAASVIAARKAAFEAQLAAIYTPNDDEFLKEAYQEAKATCRAADEKLAAFFRERGVPESFRARIQAEWYGRGENAIAERRSELRRAGYAQLEADLSILQEGIEQRGVELRGQLLFGGLESEAARQFVASLPNLQDLVPPLDLEEVKRLAGKERALARMKRADEMAQLQAECRAFLPRMSGAVEQGEPN